LVEGYLLARPHSAHLRCFLLFFNGFSATGPPLTGMRESAIHLSGAAVSSFNAIRLGAPDASPGTCVTFTASIVWVSARDERLAQLQALPVRARASHGCAACDGWFDCMDCRRRADISTGRQSSASP
jgi:hypothetical protein